MVLTLWALGLGAYTWHWLRQPLRMVQITQTCTTRSLVAIKVDETPPLRSAALHLAKDLWKIGESEAAWQQSSGDATSSEQDLAAQLHQPFS